MTDNRVYRFFLKNATAAEWEKTDYILGPGEPGVEIDTHKMKLGDGHTPWNKIEYIQGSSDSIKLEYDEKTSVIKLKDGNKVISEIDLSVLSKDNYLDKVEYDKDKSILNFIWDNGKNQEIYLNIPAEIEDALQKAKDSGEFKGDPGPQGPKGDTGERGPQGEQGPKGDGINASIQEGQGINTIVANDIANNEAYGNYSSVFGDNNITGTKAFKIIEVDKTNKTMTLNSIEGLSVGLECSCQYSSNYDFFGVITAIDLNNNLITLNNIPSDEFNKNNINILWIPSNPKLGEDTIILGTGAAVVGSGNKASQEGAFSSGKNNISGGKNSVTGGSGNKAGFCSAIFGQNNTGTQWAIIGGYNNKLLAPFGFVAGNNNKINSQYCGSLGRGNTINGEGSFVTGQASAINSINSLASGINNTIEATAKESFAVGSNNIIKAPHSAAIGFKHTINASANGRAFAAGSGNTVSHNFSAAIGHALTTSRDSQIVVGRQNINDSTAMFIVGNGTAADKLNNAFVVKETGDAVVSGSLKAKTATISGDLYANAYTGTSGKVVINSATNTATGDSSFSGGSASQALSRFSFAFGNGSIAGTTNDNGKYAVAIGFQAKAIKDGAVAIGWGVNTSHDYSTVFGINTKSSAPKQFVCGTWNALDTDSIFIVGNGVSDASRNYAFNIKKTGQALLGNADILNDEKAVVTKKYLDTVFSQLTSNGLKKQLITAINGNKVTINGVEQGAVENTIYLLKDINAVGEDIYKEYTLIGNPAILTMIGDTSVDLSNYATIEYIDNKKTKWENIEDAPIESVKYGDTNINNMRVNIYANDTLTLDSSVLTNIYATGYLKLSSTEIDINSHVGTKIKNIVDPVNDKDAVNKFYVDNLIKNIDLSNYYTKTEIDSKIGEIETALVSIIAIQESYLGGAE